MLPVTDGGPDHVDNYLYALGGSFNMSISNRFDSFNCYMAGLIKAEKAVAVALRVAATPSLHKHIPIRDPGKAGPTLFAFPPGCSSAKDMYELGRAQWTRMRAIVTSRDSSFMRCRLVFISECVCII